MPTMAKHRERMNELVAKHRRACQRIKEEKEAIALAQQRMSHSEEAQKILQAVAVYAQERAHEKIAGVVSSALETVFGENAYALKLDFLKKRGRTEANLTFIRDDKVYDPMETAEGGQIDVAAFGLRLVNLKIAMPHKRPVLFLDEPFRGVNGAEYRARAAQLITALAEQLNVQIILATGYEWLKIGKVVEL